MAIWPLAFYAAESQFIGESHVVKLRRQDTDVLIGKHKYASSMLALLILSSQSGRSHVICYQHGSVVFVAFFIIILILPLTCGIMSFIKTPNVVHVQP